MSNFFWILCFLFGFFFVHNLIHYPYMVGAMCLFYLVIQVIYQRRLIYSRYPVIGIPDKDNVTVLLLLFKLRCSEIARMHKVVQRYREEAKGGKWVEPYLENHFYCRTDTRYYDDKKLEKLREKSKAKAAKLLNGKFNFSSWNPDLGTHNDLNDLMISIMLEYGIHYTKPLRAIKTYGLLDKTIDALISEYDRFNSRSSSIFIDKFILGFFLKPKILNSRENIDETWKEIIAALKAALIFLKMEGDTSFNIEEILEEIKTLESLQYSLFSLFFISQKNTSDDEKLFLEKNLTFGDKKNNPISGLC